MQPTKRYGKPQPYSPGTQRNNRIERYDKRTGKRKHRETAQQLDKTTKQLSKVQAQLDLNREQLDDTRNQRNFYRNVVVENTGAQITATFRKRNPSSFQRNPFGPPQLNTDEGSHLLEPVSDGNGVGFNVLSSSFGSMSSLSSLGGTQSTLEMSDAPLLSQPSPSASPLNNGHSSANEVVTGLPHTRQVRPPLVIGSPMASDRRSRSRSLTPVTPGLAQPTQTDGSSTPIENSPLQNPPSTGSFQIVFNSDSPDNYLARTSSLVTPGSSSLPPPPNGSSQQRRSRSRPPAAASPSSQGSQSPSSPNQIVPPQANGSSRRSSRSSTPIVPSPAQKRTSRESSVISNHSNGSRSLRGRSTSVVLQSPASQTQIFDIPGIEEDQHQPNFHLDGSISAYFNSMFSNFTLPKVKLTACQVVSVVAGIFTVGGLVLLNFSGTHHSFTVTWRD